MGRILFLVLALCSVRGLDGQTIQPALPPGVSIQMHATPQTATVGDPIRLDLNISMPAGYRAEIPEIGKELGDFSILEFSPGPGTPVQQSAYIVAALYRTGTFSFPPVSIRLRAPDGKFIMAATPPVRIDVRSVLSDKDKDLKDLKKQAEMPERFRWELWLAGLIIAAIVAILASRFWKRRKNRAPTLPAPQPQNLLDLAEAELRTLLAGGYPAGHAVKPFYVRLSDIVKRILEAGYQIQTAEKTTSEIMDELSSQTGGPRRDLQEIESFLQRCDLVKFAKYLPSSKENDSAAKDSLHILEISRALVRSRQPADLTGSLVDGKEPEGA